jgi:hypothetical protein
VRSSFTASRVEASLQMNKPLEAKALSQNFELFLFQGLLNNCNTRSETLRTVSCREHKDAFANVAASKQKYDCNRFIRKSKRRLQSLAFQIGTIIAQASRDRQKMFESNSMQEALDQHLEPGRFKEVT